MRKNQQIVKSIDLFNTSDFVFLPISTVFARRLQAQVDRTGAELARCAGADDVDGCLRVLVEANKAHSAVEQARNAVLLAYCDLYHLNPLQHSFLDLVSAHKTAIQDAAARGEAAQPSAGILGLINDIVAGPL